MATTLRDHETRARALLDLGGPMIKRARESSMETDERATFLALVTQVEAIARCFAVERRVDVGDHGKTLDDFFRLHHALSIKLRATPVRPDQVRAKVAELIRDHATAMDLMAAAMRRMRGRPVWAECAPVLLACTRVHVGSARIANVA